MHSSAAVPLAIVDVGGHQLGWSGIINDCTWRTLAEPVADARDAQSIVIQTGDAQVDDGVRPRIGVRGHERIVASLLLHATRATTTP